MYGFVIFTIIFPRSNDSAQRLYYYLSDLRTQQFQDAPAPLIFDLAKIPRDSSKVHSRLATQRLAGEIGVMSSALPGAIRDRNRRRELFHRAMQIRRLDAGIRGSLMDRAFRSADLCDAAKFDADFGAWLAQAALPEGGPRLLLTGSSPPGMNVGCTSTSPRISVARSIPIAAISHLPWSALNHVSMDHGRVDRRQGRERVEPALSEPAAPNRRRAAPECYGGPAGARRHRRR